MFRLLEKFRLYPHPAKRCPRSQTSSHVHRGSHPRDPELFWSRKDRRSVAESVASVVATGNGLDRNIRKVPHVDQARTVKE
jgi:hypothetical protein